VFELSDILVIICEMLAEELFHKHLRTPYIFIAGETLNEKTKTKAGSGM
jgi:hypothetical protein